MIDISVKNTVVTEDNNIGAIICHTPKCTFVTDTLSDNKSLNCKLVRTLDEFNEYFGDPFIDPSVYSDLVLAYDLVRRNVPMYISSVYDMHDVSDDDFSLVSYNGCTEFYFTDKDGYDTVGYKLKSNIKFTKELDKFLCKSCNFVARWRCLQGKQARKLEAYFLYVDSFRSVV